MKGSSPLRGYWTSSRELLYQGAGKEKQAEEEPTQAKGMECFKMEPEAPGASAGLSPMEHRVGCGPDVAANAMEVTSRDCEHGDSVFAIMKCTETERGTLEF